MFDGVNASAAYAETLPRDALKPAGLGLQMTDDQNTASAPKRTLTEQGEFACAREFYNFVFKYCEGIEREAVDPTTSAGAASPCLALDGACWVARAKFGESSMELRECPTHFFAMP